MLFWRLCESRGASNLGWRRSAHAALLATSSALATRTNRTAQRKELKHGHRIEDAGLAFAAKRLVRIGSSFRADLQQSIQIETGYEIRNAQNRAHSPSGGNYIDD
jgi:hypothetical protein